MDVRKNPYMMKHPLVSRHSYSRLRIVKCTLDAPFCFSELSFDTLFIEIIIIMIIIIILSSEEDCHQLLIL